mmetsp:Transcript_17320/g.15224  ORF Transcript_17320/g.15224 Transcript_17320/m.15224 type:complete len:180 (+) Transcript_17320:721-1260(+)
MRIDISIKSKTNSMFYFQKLFEPAITTMEDVKKAVTASSPLYRVDCFDLYLDDKIVDLKSTIESFGFKKKANLELKLKDNAVIVNLECDPIKKKKLFLKSEKIFSLVDGILAPEAKLGYKGDEVKREQTFEEIGFQDGGVIISEGPYLGFKVYVKTLTGKTVEIIVDTGYLIEDVKSAI